MRLEIRAFFRQVESDHLLVHSRVLYGCEEKKKTTEMKQTSFNKA